MTETMKKMTFSRLFLATLACLILLASSSSNEARGQLDSGFNQLNLGGESAQDEPLIVTSWFKVKEGSNEGTLNVRATIGEGRHLYSQNHSGVEVKTSFKVAESDQYTVTGGFQPDVDPYKHEKDGKNYEEFEHEVTWTAPVTFTEGVDPSTASIEITFRGQTCDATSCLPPVKEDLVATFDGYDVEARINEKFHPAGSHVLFESTLQRVDGAGPIAPGDLVRLDITAEPTEGFHIYAHRNTKAESDTDYPTLIHLNKTNGWTVSGPIESEVAVEHDVFGVMQKYHETPVTWSYEIEVPEDAESKTYSLSGKLGFQTCDATGCDQFSAVGFKVDVPVGGEPTGVVPVAFNSDANYENVQESLLSAAVNAPKSAGEWEGMTLPIVLPLAFLAGLILNIMPCVLPVIGLKIMSFVQQAGENPVRVFLLNMVFSLGMIAVFMILATLAVFFGYGWGELYESLLFKVIMIAVVFVFGLSFFGLWEIPIPGFVGTGSASKAAEKEGMIGAFLKGILTTLLATPCSGPLLIPAVVWAIAQPAGVTYLVFLAMGLGMAVPYLIIGAFPKLAGFLPKPGNWMETFKQLMGFVLMGTCVFFVGSVGAKNVVPVLSLMVFLSLACWWIGRTSLAAEFGDKAKAWTIASVIGAIGIWFSFYFLLPQHELEYQPFTRVVLEEHLEAGETVFVDFTADW